LNAIFERGSEVPADHRLPTASLSYEQRKAADQLAKALQMHEINATMRALKKMWEEHGDGTQSPATPAACSR
jgi:hypothetical protein